MSEEKYCLFIARKTEEGLDIIGFPSNDLYSLRRLADVTVQLSYVSDVIITPKRDGWPFWGSALYERKNFRGGNTFKEEGRFYADLTERLDDVDKRVLDALYRAKGEEFRQLIEEMPPHS